jgi:hypothetical protein
METFDLLVAGVKLTVFIGLVVQALKISGITNETALGVAPWATAFAFLVLAGVEKFVPGSAEYVQWVLTAVMGAAGAVVGYFYAGKPALQAITNRAVTSTQLELEKEARLEAE